MFTIRTAFRWINEELKNSNSAPLEAELILRKVLNFSREEFYQNFEYPLSPEEIDRLGSLVERRKQQYPLIYLIGKKEFFGLELLVNESVMIPRPETELLVEEALRILGTLESDSFKVVDLGTGSGCVAVSLAYYLPHILIYAVDISEEALEVARENARRYNLEKKIVFLQGDLFQPLEALDLEGKIDLVISNPPYIPSGEFPFLPPEVRDYEPKMALEGGEKGLSFYRHIFFAAPQYLRRGGWLVLELGPAIAVKKLISRRPEFKEIEIKNDYAGIPRVLVCRHL